MTRTRTIQAAVAAAAAGMVWAAVDRPWLRGGATRSEARAVLPGDELVTPAQLQATRAVTIAAPPAAVWPWLVQMGYGRAGWYAFDQLDNGGRGSVDRIVPELQDLAVGDIVRDATGPFGFRVVVLDAPRVLVFRATLHPLTGRPVDPSAGDTHLDLSWAFVLRELPEPAPEAGGTRLLVRVRYRHTRKAWVRAMVHGYEVADAASARRMLAGLKARAESTGQPFTEPATIPSMN